MENGIRTHNPENCELNLEKLKSDNFLKITDKEKKLYELLIKWDETETLPRILEGIVRVLNDIENPIRFSQAANSIRGLADKLLNKRSIQFESQIILEKEFEDLKESFQNVLEKCLDKISDTNDKTQTEKLANGLLLLNKLFEIRESFINIHFNLYLIREILTKAGKYKDKPVIAGSINQAINRLGEMGYYDFRDLLIERRE